MHITIRKLGLWWGPDCTEGFLKQHNLKLIIRSHEGPDARAGRDGFVDMLSGYSMDHEGESGKLYTLFSAPDYPQECMFSNLIHEMMEYYKKCSVHFISNLHMGTVTDILTIGDITTKEHMQYWSRLILQILPFTHSNPMVDPYVDFDGIEMDSSQLDSSQMASASAFSDPQMFYPSVLLE